MTLMDYQQKQADLDSVKYLDAIQKRDEVFQKIQGLDGKFNPNLVAVDEIIKERENIFHDLKLLESEVNLREKNLNNLTTISKKYETIKSAKLFELKNRNLQQINDIELRKRKYQLIKYQNFLNEEAIHLLWVLLVILIVSCLFVMCSVLKVPGFNSTAVLALIFGALGFYGVYLFKILLVDNVNIDIYNIDMHQYKKPTDAELTRDKNMKDKLLALRSKSSGNKCPNQGEYEYQALEDITDNEVETVRNNMEADNDGQGCLKLTQS